MEIVGTIISAQDEPNKSGEGESFTVRFRESNGKDWVPFKLFQNSLKEKATELKGKVNSAKLTVEKPEGKKFWDLISVEAIEPAEAMVALTSKDDAIAAQVAAKIVKDLWIMGTIPQDDPLCVALRAWCFHCLPPVSSKDEAKETSRASGNKPVPKPAPLYKDKDGDDVSNATQSQITALKKMLGTPGDDEFTNAIRTRFGDEALQIKDLTKNEAGDWITELQKEV